MVVFINIQRATVCSALCLFNHTSRFDEICIVGGLCGVNHVKL